MDHAATAAVRADAAHGVAALLRTIQAGERPEESFRRLFELYHPAVHGFFARRGLAPQDCQDLTQETFLGIHRGMGSFRIGEPFEAWLFTIAANAYRKKRRYEMAGVRLGQTVPLPQPGEEPAGAAVERQIAAPAAAEEAALREERERLLRAAVERLPEQMRACLILRVYRDLKYREVATALRLSIETVKAHLFQARQRLKGELGSYFQDAVLDGGGEDS